MRLAIDHVTLTPDGRLSSTPGMGISEAGASLPWQVARPSLYSLCSLEGLASDDVANLVTDTLHGEFAKQASRSVTSCLLRSMRRALDSLQTENDRSLPQHRCSGAICAATVKGDTLYFAHVGGALVYAFDGREVRRYGGPDRGNGSSEPSAEECEIGLGSCPIGASTALILASPLLAVLMSDAEVLEAIVKYGAAGMLDRFDSKYQEAHPSCCLSVASLLAASSDAGNEKADSGLPVAPSSPTAPRLPEPAPAPRPPREDHERVRPAWEAPSGARTAMAPEPPRREPVYGGSSSVAVATLAVDPPRRTVGAAPGLFAGRLTSMLGPSVARVLLRFSVAAILIALLAVGLYIAEQAWKSHNDQSKAAEMLTLVEQKEKDALAATDEATRRWLLADASRLAEQALAVRSNDPGLVSVASRIRTTLDAANGVVRLAGLQQLADFASLDAGSQPSALVLAGSSLYAVDQGTGSLWYLNLGKDLGALGPPTRIWKSGDTVDGEGLGDAIAAFWMYGGAPGVPEQAYAIDSSGFLVRCADGSAAQPAKLPAAGALSQVSAAAGQAGNLYVLDSQNRVMWRYVPGADGYDAAPQEYLTDAMAPGLENAVDMAVDGSLYVLLSTGQINKYTTGRAQSFPALTPDTEMRRPSSIFASPRSRHIYVADAGNARVVEFTKDGQYVRQIVAPNEGFEGLRSVAVDEEQGLLYAVVGARAFVAQLPPTDS